MYRVGICGHYGGGKIYLDGQTVKTKIFTKELANKIGEQNIQIVDTHGWKRNPLSLIIKCIMLLSRCQNIIIFPAQNGIKVLSLLFVILNRVFNRKLHYVVIGGWLPELLEKNSVLKNRVSKFDGVYVETY
ncbi:MAG TPA: glycosyltransferase family 1 protein, partial [Bacilli bacterium]|nr:glycosyltransferase family 1 protein [Bacilli bacterium]